MQAVGNAEQLLDADDNGRLHNPVVRGVGNLRSHDDFSSRNEKHVAQAADQFGVESYLFHNM